MKLIKLISLLLASISILSMIVGCNNEVVEAPTSADQPTTTLTTTKAPDTTKEPNSGTVETVTQGIKWPWEYVADAEAKAAEEEWILLNEYFELEKSVVLKDSYYNNHLGTFVPSEKSNTVLEIYAVEAVFANHMFDTWTTMVINFPNHSASTEIRCPYELQLQDSKTHSFEMYEDSEHTIPVNRFYVEFESPMIVDLENLEMINGKEIKLEYTYSIVPDVNELVEVRLWGKLIEEKN